MSAWSLRGLVLAGVVRLRGRYGILAVVLALSAAVTTFGAALGTYVRDESSDDAAATEALRMISVYPADAEVSDETLARIRSSDDVDSVTPLVRVPAGVQATGADVTLVGVSPDALPPSLVAGGFGSAGAGGDWVVLPATGTGPLGEEVDYSGLIGSEVVLTVTVALDAETGTTRDLPFRVTGVADPEYQVDAVNAAYISLDRATSLYLDRLGLSGTAALESVGGYEKATVLATSQEAVDDVVRRLQADGLQAVSRLQEVDSLPGVISLVRLASTAVTVALVVVCLVASLLLTLALTRQRTNELGVLRATGWSSARVLVAWTAELAVVSVGSVLAGCVLGLVVSDRVGGALRSSLSGGELGDVSFGLSSLVPPLCLAVLACAAGAAVISRATRQDVATLMKALV